MVTEFLATSTESVSSPPAVAPTLRQRTALGFLWLLGQTLGTKVVSVVGQILLARLLLKEDYGLVGLAYTVSSVGVFVQWSGLKEILLQRQRHFRRWANAAFWMSLFLGLVSGGIMAASAPLAARLFASDRVIGLVLVIALGSPLTALSTVEGTLTLIQLRFKLQAVLGFGTATLTVLLNVLFAWLGLGPYSFVLPLPLVALVRWSILHWATRDAMRGMLRSHPQLKRWKYLWGDSWMQMGIGVCGLIVLQGDYFALGLFRSKEIVGIYYFGFNLSMQTAQLLGMNVTGVLLPALSKLLLEPERQLRAFFSALRLLAFVAVPICLLQAVLAPAGMRLLFGNKWEASVPVVQILSIAMVWLVYAWQSGMLLQAQRRIKTSLVYSIWSVVIFLGLVVPAAWFGGAVSVAIAVTIAFAILSVLAMYMATVQMGASWREMAGLFLKPIGLTLVATAPVAALMMAWNPRFAGTETAGLFIGALLGGIFYLVLLKSFVPDVWQLLRQRFSRTLSRFDKRARRLLWRSELR